MVRRATPIVLAVLILVLLPSAASPAAAQDSRQILITPAFAILKWDDTAIGFNVDVAVPIRQMTTAAIDIVGDFSFLRFAGDKETDLFFSAAPRVRFTGNPSATPFVQAQFGVNRFSDEGFSGTNFFIGPGGGVILPIGKGLRAKVQVDFQFVLFEGGHDTLTRVSLGIELPRRN